MTTALEDALASITAMLAGKGAATQRHIAANTAYAEALDALPYQTDESEALTSEVWSAVNRVSAIIEDFAADLADALLSLPVDQPDPEPEEATVPHPDPITPDNGLGLIPVPDAVCYCADFQNLHDASCDCGFTVHHESECGGCANGEFCCGSYT